MYVRTIYDFAFVTYADLPRGAIKNNSMRRLAATTLMEILPPHIAERVNKKMEEDPGSSHDFLSLVGLVSYYGSGVGCRNLLIIILLRMFYTSST